MAPACQAKRVDLGLVAAPVFILASTRSYYTEEKKVIKVRWKC